MPTLTMMPAGAGPGQTHHHHFLPRNGPPPTTPMFHRRGVGATRAASTASLSSKDSSDSDEDAITPCPPPHHHHHLHAQHEQQQQQYDHHCEAGVSINTTQTTHYTRPPLRSATAQNRHSSSSWRTSQVFSGSGSGSEMPPGGENMTTNAAATIDAETLWRRMLAVQRVFGCYNSARMRAALEMDGEEDGFIPSKTGLDLLNDSIDQQLPDEARRQLEEYLEHGDDSAILSASSASRGRRKGWRNRLMYIPSLH